MRSKPIAMALLAIASLPSCMTTNLYAWADTKIESPVEQDFRITVRKLALIPALVGDIVLLPIQFVTGFHPYGDLVKPDPPYVRYTDRTERYPDDR